MKAFALLKSICIRKITVPFQSRCFQPDFVPADPKSKPKRYKLPPSYDPYGPRPPPSDKIIQLAEKIAALPPEERGGSAKVEEKVEKTTFDIKLEKFDATAKIKVIKEVRGFTSLGLKEAKEMVEKAPVLIKQGVTKEEANEIIKKIKAAGDSGFTISRLDKLTPLPSAEEILSQKLVEDRQCYLPVKTWIVQTKWMLSDGTMLVMSNGINWCRICSEGCAGSWWW
ncbi:hypothetical protein L6452_39650 [Arctium lappa]|uniref:Uncharacterized protein n=1 Tax=Arctium lappa TaxID=4217 RepID=A0ACB8XTC7_ARCLA|nr:hypothetical protein L6452_39650 [Arctium lappa]